MMPLRSMADTSPQLTRMEVELSATPVILLGGLKGAVKEECATKYQKMMFKAKPL